MTDDIYNAFNKDKVTTAIFIDFKKAFDTLDHKILLKKLDIQGFGMNTVKLIESYLNNRKQCTKANNIISKLDPITCGVGETGAH